MGLRADRCADPRGGLEKLSAGVSGLVKKNLDCTVEQNIITEPSPGPTQTRLYNHRRWLEALKFRIYKVEGFTYLYDIL